MSWMQVERSRLCLILCPSLIDHQRSYDYLYYCKQLLLSYSPFGYHLKLQRVTILLCSDTENMPFSGVYLLHYSLVFRCVDPWTLGEEYICVLVFAI